MDAKSLSLLLQPRGWDLLASLPPYDESQVIALGETLRGQGFEPELVAAALTQSRLRARAVAKFGSFAAGMLFTPDGLEQASRLPVAARHARRFRDAGLAHVADLGCGIGGDAMAMAALGLRITAVERDETTAAVATVNLRHWPESRVVAADARQVDLADVDGVWLDPARRTGHGGRSSRIFDPEAFSPPLSFVEALARDGFGPGRTRHAVGAKLGPGLPHDRLPAGAEAQWVSVGGDVVEVGLWFGPLRRAGIRRAALVLPAASGPVAEVTDVDLPTPAVARPGRYLYEPDGAVIRAGLVGHVAERVSGWLVDPSIAYVSSDRRVDTPVAHGYLVDDVLPFGLKRLRAYLRDRGVGRLTVKKRGTAVTPESLRQQLRLSGPNEATIVLTRIAGQQSVLVVTPLL